MEMLEIPLIEDHAVPDTYTAGVARIERMSNGMVRVVYYVDQTGPDGRPVHVVVAKLVRPLSSLGHAMKLFENAVENGKVPPVEAARAYRVQ